MQANQRGQARKAMNEVITHRKPQELQLTNDRGDHYRVWLWPLDSPEVAVCALCIHLPDELVLLTSREQDCLKLLAHGMSAGKIAQRLSIATSTVHTHFRRAREKLKLPSLEALISFAARHCDIFPNLPGEQPGGESADSRIDDRHGKIPHPFGLLKGARALKS